MPNTLIWRGDAQATRQVELVTFTNIEPGDQFILTINRKSITITVSAAVSGAQNLLNNVVAQFVAAINASTIPEWEEITASNTLDSDNVIVGLTLTGPSDGKPFTVTGTTADAGNFAVSVTELQAGVAAANEKQQVTLAQGVSGGTFTLSFDGEVTGNIAWNANAAAVDAALEALSNIAAGDVTVTGDGPWVVEFLQTYAAIDVSLLVADGTNLTGTQTITVAEVTKGKPASSCSWALVRTTDAAFSFSLSDTAIPTGVGGTVWFASGNTAAAVQLGIETYIDGVNSGDVLVTGSAGTFTIEWTGALAGVNVTNSAASNCTITVTDAVLTAVAEVQDITVPTATGGTYTLTFRGQTTAGIAYNANAAAVDAALEALSTIAAGEVAVTLQATYPASVVFRATFALTLAGQDLPLIVGNAASLTGAAVYVGTTHSAVTAANERQNVTLTNSPSGGTFTLSYGGFTTGALTFDESAADIETALELLASIDAVAVSGADGGPWLVEFQGTLAATDVALMTGDATGLTGGGSQGITVTPSVTGTGPYHWDEANNWHDPAVPGTATAPAAGDTIWFQDSDVDCLYGLETNTGDTLAALHVMASYTGNIGLNSVSDSDYWEYRPLNLAAGFTNVYVGEGEGGGSARIRLDLEAIASTVEVFRTGTSPNNLPAFIYKGGAATTALRVFRGSVGVAKGLASDTANCQTLTVGYITSQTSDAEVTIGTGCGTITTVDKSGGSLVVEDVALTTVVHDGGEMTIDGAGAVATLRINEGEVYYRSSGTITTLLAAQGGTVDFSQSHVARTVTTLTMYSGSTVLDPFNTVTFTNPIILDRCSLPEVTLDVGVHRTLAVAAGA